jgi:molybdenum cofactor cytidylyltransferase
MTGLIILAAGMGERFGKPKQNLIFQNQTLLQRAIATASISTCRPILVVTGAHANLIDLPVNNPDVKLIFNKQWAEGMASSIRIGIEAMKAYPNVERALILLCDQPLVTSMLIDNMLQEQKISGKAIVACTYNNTVGVPVIFHRTIFEELLSLTGHEGAKQILKNHPDNIATVLFEEGSLDIDTPGDYERLIQGYQP